MTLNEMMVRCRQLRNERPGTEGYDDPLSYLDDCVVVTDEVAIRTYCLFKHFTTDVTSATASYCIPNLFKIKEVQFMKDDGNWQTLKTFYPEEADMRQGARWSTYPQMADPPRQAVIGGPGSPVILAPTPAVSRTAALRFGGNWKPGNVWGYDSTGVAITASWTVENPLPTWAQDVVPIGMALERAARYPIPEDAFRIPRLQAQYDARIAQIHGNTNVYFPASTNSYYVAGPLATV